MVEPFFASDVEDMVNGTVAPDPAGVLPPISAECHAALPWLGVHRGREAAEEFLGLAHARSSPREIKQHVRVVPAADIVLRANRRYFIFDPNGIA